ncbi:GlxA family transcriptional regulator [Plastoroseomonas hellenica]|uniref:GlxA family transcriptional regulator n=1 Tax=Plastoroseomonas hellenica TaxID=2687306 RepID=UPI001BA5D7D7|nr:helix-turn-helix domain-containing protein [Plastoroseomonas hellenica]MBR0643882.1 helix-turn-helix domain-containing protein [Plastoroseomonas hellenica]
MHRVAILAMHGFVPSDLAIPCDVFGRLQAPDGTPAYRVTVCGEAEEVRTGAFALRAASGLDRFDEAETVIIPGIEDPSRPIPPTVLAAIRSAWAKGARVASICSGAFVLAATGLLDGRRATTHWIGAAELARRFPAIAVDPGVLFVDEGRIVTSAGASAGLDMCLHLIRRDHGQAVAAQAARLAVAPLDREGGQAQYIRHEPPGSAASLAPLLDWMRENAHRPLDVETLAARAGVSRRSFARRFREQTGTTPLQWLLRMRVLLAQALLETTPNSIDDIAMATGFEAAVTFRARFRRFVGVSPSAYRRRFRAG